MKSLLLTREAFRETVFKRDRCRCVFCGAEAVDPHHIIERKLWPDGGYYLDNGASVCEVCHLKCESTELSVEEVRKACGITTILLPPQMSVDIIYDKWGNQILEDGRRLCGPLFWNDGCQRALEKLLDTFEL